MLNTRASKAGAVLMALFFILTYLLPLDGRLLWQPDETRYAEISREMLQHGNWIVPYFLDIRYFEKPVAGYWINNISQWIFGHNNFAVRFGSVFSILASAFLLYRLAMMMWQCRQTAFVSSLIYISMFIVFSIGTYSVLDPMFSLWITAGIVSCYWALKAGSIRERFLAWSVLGLTCGMAFMTKGFLALALPVIAMIPVTIYQKRFLEMICFGPVAVIFAILISLPWVITVALSESHYWHYFFWVEHIQRFASDKAQHIAPIWYYLPILVLGVIPWLGLLPGALIKSWKERNSHPEMFFLFCWFIAPFIFFSIAKGKLPTYVLPFIGPLAIMMAKYSVDCVRNGNMKALKINGLVNVFIGLIAILVLFGMETLVNPPLYQPNEWLKWIMGIIAFGFWGVVGYLCFTHDGKHWLWASACSIVLSLSIGSALPSKTINSKLPQFFIRQNEKALADSKYILSQSVGVGAAIAWELKRSDIYMFDRPGELEYGISYPDSQHRYVTGEEFPEWLAKARKQGQVSIVFLLSSKGSLPALPEPDLVRSNHRFVLVIYKKQP
ncbi:lipid IV(A) 4-amino-4-deoxy-L-arabinosyltransferase [Xenorhabdus nematophila]|uniref:lipid IV(A) 4-amino-4-deoxy-L-arabinosyltransferase n=1 Tax=Xenorhabdus nematophila TaxID=628 RepID=UPI00054285E8|nr:lipid IV(A) 4-amino-4-deoxy-L-arabinosyltransferase [Xenorhabdus nematophila]CEF33738.1 4-amino-4-deoxy-L-arabinose transferase (lipid A modification) [Xenorhabdus nematophila str. Websteri]AYA40447.1 lipid IV(A) 4-amino-4-deoxy-L-arabinosyltransferase [Xenorhabdus nematophila]MBA0019179.1 lipid IV(A) 4-amino-4-deoxy-L-arabinosyltransferase [Xenorhabdus nematophila]MCB4425688.1 lipid IV(A) 4-amino-4-deoxy-L-arabinosyltransferase [Xenorhabdus nematophila]QNJ38079.1 lipid IV(A) 4-amino-4-deox